MSWLRQALERILVAIDGSKQSEKIVEYSCQLAAKMSSSIILTYVSRDPEFMEDYVEIQGRTLNRKAAKSVELAESVTTKLAEKVEASGIPYEVLLETGDPAEKIVQNAAEKKVAMIVIGLKGLHGIDKIMSLGSVARKVIETSPCPVVVVTGS